jgi:GNAT superfamily N-acetyltransferase
MPISDAPRIESNVTLKNGLVVTIRDLRTDDRDAIARADATHELAFVAAIGTPPTHQIIGSCRSVELETKSSRRAAEAAFVVEEDYQGLGIAGRLFDHLVHVARSRGIAELRGDVLASNQSMLRVIRRSGLPTRFRHDGATVHLIISLT